jgi:hypothetical protein
VETTSIYNFVNRASDDPFHPVDISEHFHTFLQQSFRANPNPFRLPARLDDWLCELIENSFDAYAKQGLQCGDKLTLTITLYLSAKKATIELRDNAGGFPGFKKGEHFTLDKIKPEKKDKSQFLGGVGMGIANFGLFVKQNNIQTSFRNRKNSDGAVVSLHLPLCA